MGKNGSILNWEKLGKSKIFKGYNVFKKIIGHPTECFYQFIKLNINLEGVLLIRYFILSRIFVFATIKT